MHLTVIVISFYNQSAISALQSAAGTPQALHADLMVISRHTTTKYGMVSSS
jgi:hypothetical protein